MKTYTTSKDYARLVRLLDEGHKVALISNLGYLDTAHKEDDGIYNIDDVYMERPATVIKHCEEHELEYIPPTASLTLEDVRQILGMRDPYPTWDIMARLIKAADILLDAKDYDGDGWELIHRAREMAKTRITEMKETYRKLLKAEGE